MKWLISGVLSAKSQQLQYSAAMRYFSSAASICSCKQTFKQQGEGWGRGADLMREVLQQF